MAHVLPGVRRRPRVVGVRVVLMHSCLSVYGLYSVLGNFVRGLWAVVLHPQMQAEAVDDQGGSASQDRSRRQEASYAGVRGFQEKGSGGGDPTCMPHALASPPVLARAEVVLEFRKFRGRDNCARQVPCAGQFSSITCQAYASAFVSREECAESASSGRRLKVET